MIVKSISAIIFKDFDLVKLVHFGFGHSPVTRLNSKKKKNIIFMPMNIFTAISKETGPP